MCNAYISGEAKLLNADGKAAFEFQDNGQYAVGVDGTATLAHAKAEAGVSFLSYKVYDGTATGNQKDDLLKLKLGVSGNAGASFAVYSESKTAIETDWININATTLKIKGSFLLGGNIEITMPTPYFKWPW